MGPGLVARQVVFCPPQYGGGAGQALSLLGQSIYLDQEDLSPPVKSCQIRSVPGPLALFVWEESLV